MRGKGEGSIFRVPKDTTQPLKYWQAAIELPPHPDGDRRRKVVRSKDKALLLGRMQKLQQEKTANGGDLPTRSITVAQWMNEYLQTIAKPKLSPKTLETYNGLIRREVLPRIGKIKLDKLTPADLRKLYKAITDKGLSSTTASQVHRILSRALKYAHRDGLIPRNVATLVDTPQIATPVTKALTVTEAMKVLDTAHSDRLASLWSAILYTGARQGELLGLELDRVIMSLDPETGEEHWVMDLSWQLQRHTWQHGCDPACGRRGTSCPQRHITFPVGKENRHISGALYWTRPKTKAGWRIIPLVEPLRTMVLERIQVARTETNPRGLVWTTNAGKAIDPRLESEAWDRLLKQAEVTDVRLHDGRHTTVDLLLAADVPMDVIREIVGHSSRITTEGYKSKGNQVRLRKAMTALSTLVIPPAGESSGTPVIGA